MPSMSNLGAVRCIRLAWHNRRKAADAAVTVAADEWPIDSNSAVRVVACLDPKAHLFRLLVHHHDGTEILGGLFDWGTVQAMMRAGKSRDIAGPIARSLASK